MSDSGLYVKPVTVVTVGIDVAESDRKVETEAGLQREIIAF